MKTIVNCETGEQVDIPLTQEEIAANEAAAAQAEADRLVREAEVVAAQAAKESAQAKLANLGLTPKEIAALSK